MGSGFTPVTPSSYPPRAHGHDPAVVGSGGALDNLVVTAGKLASTLDLSAKTLTLPSNVVSGNVIADSGISAMAKLASGIKNVASGLPTLDANILLALAQIPQLGRSAVGSGTTTVTTDTDLFSFNPTGAYILVVIARLYVSSGIVGVKITDSANNTLATGSHVIASDGGISQNAGAYAPSSTMWCIMIRRGTETGSGSVKIRGSANLGQAFASAIMMWC